MTLQLSFDDGPSEWTPQILDLLAEFGVKATFFVVGQNIAGREHILARTAADGHVIGNHTWSHPRLTDPGLTHNTIWRQLKDTNAALFAVTDSNPSVWRPPYFGTDDRVSAIAAEFGMAHVDADVVPDDWMRTDPEEIADLVLMRAAMGRDNPVVCLHDGIPPDGGSSSCTKSRQPTVDAVRIILEALA